MSYIKKLASMLRLLWRKIIRENTDCIGRDDVQAWERWKAK